MILFWGSKGYQKVLGHTQTAIECGHCNNVGTWEITEYGRKFTLYWIPLFPYGKTYFVSSRFVTTVKKSKNPKLNNI